MEVGCGNGKNFCNPRHIYYGIDISKKLLQFVPDEHKERIQFGNALKLPYKDETFDHTMSIAVIHHLATTARRLNAIHEMIRVTKNGGEILISMWAYDKNDPKRNRSSKLVPFKIKDTNKSYYRYYALTNELDFKKMIFTLENVEIKKIWYCNQNYFALLKK